MWSIVKSFKNRKLSEQNNVINTSSVDKESKSVINKLCPDTCLDTRYFSYTDMQEQDLNNEDVSLELDRQFSLEELEIAIASSKTNSAPDLDQIDNRIIGRLPSNYKEILLLIYNMIFAEGSFPEPWKDSLVILIPKPGGKGIRPISVLSCFLKVFEKLIYNRLRWFAEVNDIVPNFQFGFRQSKSCIDNLICITSYIHTGLIKNEFVACVFLDIKGAFDNVIPNILLRKLKGAGIPARIRKFVAKL